MKNNVKDHQQVPGNGRRDFLRMAATAVPAAAATALVGGEADAVEAGPKSAGLRRTRHVEAYLDTARF